MIVKNEILIDMPLYLQLGRSLDCKKYHINLNQYRNWNFIISDQIKKAYKDTAWSRLKDVKFDGPIGLTFIFYPPNNIRRDRANILSIHEKFLCDAMTELGCIPDDNDEHILWSKYITGCVDRNDPRVEILIEVVRE